MALTTTTTWFPSFWARMALRAAARIFWLSATLEPPNFCTMMGIMRSANRRGQSHFRPTMLRMCPKSGQSPDPKGVNLSGEKAIIPAPGGSVNRGFPAVCHWLRQCRSRHGQDARGTQSASPLSFLPGFIYDRGDIRHEIAIESKSDPAIAPAAAPGATGVPRVPEHSTGKMPVAHGTLRQRPLAPDPAAPIPAVRVGFRPRHPAIYRKRIDKVERCPGRRPGGRLWPRRGVARLRPL